MRPADDMTMSHSYPDLATPKPISCHSFKLSVNSDQDVRTTRIQQFLTVKKSSKAQRLSLILFCQTIGINYLTLIWLRNRNIQRSHII